MVDSETPCPRLVRLGEGTLPVGGVTYINDHQALHTVACAEGVQPPGAVTLHLYAPPVRRCVCVCVCVWSSLIVSACLYDLIWVTCVDL